MSIKNWILHKMNGLTTRPDLPREPRVSRRCARRAVGDAPRSRPNRAGDPSRRGRARGSGPRSVRAADCRDPRRARALRRQLFAAPSDDRRARSLSAHLDRRARDRAGRVRRPAAPVHPRVPSRADQGISREGSDRPAAQRERDRSLAIRRAQRRARRRGAGRGRQLQRAPRRVAQREAEPRRAALRSESHRPLVGSRARRALPRGRMRRRHRLADATSRSRSRTPTAAGTSCCDRWCRAAGMRSAKARAATSR